MEEEWQQYQVKPGEEKSPVVSIPWVLKPQGLEGDGGERVLGGGRERMSGGYICVYFSKN